MNRIIEEIVDNREGIIKVTISDSRQKVEYSKLLLRPVIIKKTPQWQVEKFKNNQAFHLNLKTEELEKFFVDEILSRYKQINLALTDKTISFFIQNSGKIKSSVQETKIKREKISQEHDRQKEFILREGENIPALVDLGVFTKDFKVVKGMYDKYKQINRFVEIIDDEVKKSSLDSITILDFGCGKSYLTFIIYYYFVKIKNIKAKIIGYDLKEEVVKDCNKIAQKYGYNDLVFVKSDVSKDVLYQEKIDMIISLHACDTATDYALNYAITKDVPYVFSVPCCQHEINLSIAKGGDFDIMLKYGIIKERFSALLTDAIRAQLLEDCGYSVDLIEFVDLAHSPKNIMIRAYKNKRTNNKNTENILKLKEKYKFNQRLFDLLNK